MNFKNWAREPLAHFLVAGALLYALFAWTGGTAVDPSSRVITVDREVQAALATQFERTMARAPTDAELDNAIQQYVRDEVLYREALRLGLDQGDAVVRRRLVSKMDMTAGIAAEVAEPSDEQLRKYFEEQAERYAADGLLTFDQLYFESEAAASEALSRKQPSQNSQSISLPETMNDAALGEIEARFGVAFATSIAGLEPKQEWQGPIQSGFGSHLVRLTARKVSQESFEALRPRIENDWRSAEIARRKAEAYEILRGAYRVEIDR